MNLLPYLQLRDPNTGQCFELFNNCATLAAVLKSPAWAPTKEANCDTCCPCDDQVSEYFGNPVLDGAWWADPLSTNASGALGIMVHDMELEPTTSARRLGETSDQAPAYVPRLLTIRGRILSNDAAGVYHLQSQLSARVSDPCGACDGWDATIRPFCPTGDNGDQEIVLPEEWVPAEPEPVDWDAMCAGGPCPEAEPLAAPGPVPTRIDSGLRTVLNVRFQYFDIDPDVEEPVESCYGADFIMVFEVWTDNEFGEPIGGLCAERSLVAEDLTDCKAHDFRQCLWLPELDLCDTTVSSGDNVAEVEPVRSTTAKNFSYCQPLFRTTRSCLTPILPIGTTATPLLVVETGITPLANFRIDIHPAYVGVPAPETCEGEEFYRSHATCGRVMIGGPVPANSRIEIDGRRNQVLLYCSGGDAERAEDIIEGWDFPTLDPSCRYWITSVADCANTAPDAGLDIFYYARFQS